MNFFLSIVLSIYSLTTIGLFIHLISFFCTKNKALYDYLFRGLCPHPASGIRLEFSGNTLNADGIRYKVRTAGTSDSDAAALPFPFYKY